MTYITDHNSCNQLHKVPRETLRRVNMLRSETQGDFEITSDGRTVWVNANCGMCVGRFTKNHVDIHASAKEQMNGVHCLDCFPSRGKSLDESWKQFKESMLTHHKVEIPEIYKPKELKK